MGNVNWDLAGFTDEMSRLGKRVGGPILVPKEIDLDLSTDELVWSFRGPGRPEIIEPEPRILDHFVQLWREKPNAILKFARTWGVLHLDRHSRSFAPVLQIHPELGIFPAIEVPPQVDQREPLAHWRYYSHHANATLNIAAALNQKRVGAIGDWECLQCLCTHPSDLGYSSRAGTLEPDLDRRTWTMPRGLEQERTFIAFEASQWLRLGSVGFRVWPADGSGMRIVVDYEFGLLGAIAFQIALTMSAADSFFTCSGCGLPYLRRKKRPKPGESNFCESCDERGVALRNADRARRERKQRARQLRADGLTISEIAKKVGARNLSTVRRWIEKGKGDGKTKARQ